MSILTHIEQAYHTIVADLDHDARDMLERSLAEAKTEETKLKADVSTALDTAKTEAGTAATKYGPDVEALVTKLVSSVEAALASHV